MTYTVAEARQKWCPFAQESVLEECNRGVTALTFNRAYDGGPAENCFCIASDCMAWREGREAWQQRDGKIIEAVQPQDILGQWVKRGYCGLAGKPE